jgi:hypothetical protein
MAASTSFGLLRKFPARRRRFFAPLRSKSTDRRQLRDLGDAVTEENPGQVQLSEAGRQSGRPVTQYNLTEQPRPSD